MQAETQKFLAQYVLVEYTISIEIYTCFSCLFLGLHPHVASLFYLSLESEKSRQKHSNNFPALYSLSLIYLDK